MARLIRMTGGNLRLLTRLLTQIERVLDVNNLDLVSADVVEAARDSLLIGQGYSHNHNKKTTAGETPKS